MNGQWKTVIVLICALVLVSVFAVLTYVENNNLYQQIKDQEKLELDLGLKNIEIENLKKLPPETIQPTEQIDQQELLDFLAGYNSAQKAYIKTLKQIMDNNGVKYPIFIYAELEE